jgi:hypothetical protein
MLTARLSESGKKALRDDTQMPPMLRLFMEIILRCEDITQEHLIGMADEVIEEFGSVEKAIEAIKAEEVKFEKIKMPG